MPTDPEDAGGLRNTLYKKETRSKRRMTPVRRFVWRIVAAIGVFLIKTFWRSCRVVRIVGDEHMAAALAASPSVIPVYWHQHQIFCSKYLFDQKARGLKLGFLISPSVDGDIGVMVVAKFGGRLFLLGDIDAVPALSDEERTEFLAVVNRAFDGKVEAVGWGHDGKAIRTMLKANAVPHQEAFLVGAGMGHQVLGEAAGLPFTKDIEGWFT